MKALLPFFSIAVIALSCTQQPSKVQTLEQLDAQMKATSQEYQRHLQREMQWAANGVEMPLDVKDSFSSIDSMYERKIKKISAQVDSISKAK